jgi:chaperonin cofactor prefoldin
VQLPWVPRKQAEEKVSSLEKDINNLSLEIAAIKKVTDQMNERMERHFKEIDDAIGSINENIKTLSKNDEAFSKNDAEITRRLEEGMKSTNASLNRLFKGLNIVYKAGNKLDKKLDESLERFQEIKARFSEIDGDIAAIKGDLREVKRAGELQSIPPGDSRYEVLEWLQKDPSLTENDLALLLGRKKDSVISDVESLRAEGYLGTPELPDLEKSRIKARK